MNKEIINGTIKITDDSFYLVEENLVKAFSPYALIVALNELFKAEIDPIHSKVSATGRSVVRVAEDTQWQEAGFGYKGLFAFLKDNLNIPIDTDKSFARTTSCWYVYLQDSYKEAFKKMLDSEENVEDNKQAIQTETQIINNEEETKNAQDYAWKEEAAHPARNEPTGDEAGMQQDQEGTQDESGASNVSTDPSGVDGVQGLADTNVKAVQEEPKPKQTRARKPKKA